MRSAFWRLDAHFINVAEVLDRWFRADLRAVRKQ
jgi:hypothetical protein